MLFASCQVYCLAFEEELTVPLKYLSLSITPLNTRKLRHNSPGPFLFWNHISTFSTTPFAHTTLAFFYNPPTCLNTTV